MGLDNGFLRKETFKEFRVRYDSDIPEIKAGISKIADRLEDICEKSDGRDETIDKRLRDVEAWKKNIDNRNKLILALAAIVIPIMSHAKSIITWMAKFVK